MSAPKRIKAWTNPVYDHSPEYGHCLWAPDDNPAVPAGASPYILLSEHERVKAQRDALLKVLKATHADLRDVPMDPYEKGALTDIQIMLDVAIAGAEMESEG